MICELKTIRIPLVMVIMFGVNGTAVQAQIAEPQMVIRREIHFPNISSQGPSILNSGATLKTDPELEAILEKAERFRQEKQYGIASKLWQSVLERSGDSLYSADDSIYYSLSQRVEQILAELGPEGGLDAWRITADASALELMAEAADPFDERMLQQIVRFFFMSTLGDDAALTLSSIYMDQHDFIGAYRMLRKIVDDYPDPTVPLVDVYTRMALCQAMIGDKEDALDTIDSARQLANDSELSRLDEVQAVIESGNGSSIGQRLHEGFTMAIANRHRSGLMPALPERLMESDLQAVWQYYFDTATLRWSDIKNIKPIFGKDISQTVADTVTAKERAMIDKWRQNRWRPKGDLLFENGRVHFKTSVDLTVWDADANSDQVVWRPLWRNEYQLDDHTRTMLNFRRQWQRGNRPTLDDSTAPDQSHEIQLFADGVASQWSIEDGILYSIEGKRFDTVPENVPDRLNAGFEFFSRRSRSNQLTAYDSATGRLLWTLPPIHSEDDIDGNVEIESPWIQSGGFMSAPIHYGGLAIVPINHGGAISVVALDPKQDGRTVWRSYLCDESENGANPWSPVNLTLDGSDLFASCGLGVVFIIDPVTGLVRFAKRYQRDGTPQTAFSRFGRGVQQMNYTSWSSDTIVAFGRQMICFSSDAKHIEAHDRNSGALIWRSDIKPLEVEIDYLLGQYDGMLYAAGRETILAFDLQQEGRMVWGGNRMFDGQTSYGRGMLTSDGIYIPVGDGIHKYSLTGKNGEAELLGKVSVELGTGAPVGNLYSDGRRTWVHGGNRVYALGPMKKESAADSIE